jgi:hypothetical protein
MAAITRRVSMGIIVVVFCVALALSLSLYWSIQRVEIRNAAQRGLNTAFHKPIHIREVKLNAGSPLKWLVLPFIRHEWLVYYQLPQGGIGLGLISQELDGKWVYEGPLTHG